MLMPRKVKYRKWMKGRSKGVESRGTTLAFGTYGLKGMETRWIPAKQLEAARRVIIRYLKKGGKVWLRVFPDKPITRKGAEVPMGGGKGSPDHYAVAMKPGRVIFEMEGIKEDMAREALTKASTKLSIKTKFIKR